MQLALFFDLERSLFYLCQGIAIVLAFGWLTKKGSWTENKLATLVGVAAIALSTIAYEWQRHSSETKEQALREQLKSAAQKANSAELRASNAEKKVADTEAHLEDMRRFSEVAKLTVMGSLSMHDIGTSFGTRLSVKMERLVKVEKNKMTFFVTPIHDQYYLEIIEEYPDFPFAYFGLAAALHHRNDPRWKEYALKAQNILLKTTTFAHCHPNHAEVLKQLTTLMKADEPTVTSAK